MIDFLKGFYRIITRKIFGKVDSAAQSMLQNRRGKFEFNNKSDIIIVIHIFYTEYLGEIASYLKNIEDDYDIYVSVCDAAHVDTVKNFFMPLSTNIMVEVHPNRGRDVGPFLTILNSGVLDDYKYACKIHAKGSKYSSLGSEWRNDILSELLGSPGRVQSILDAMKSDGNIGLVGPSGHHLSSYRYWGDNKKAVTMLCAKMSIPKDEVVLDFFAGTMFWFRPVAFTKIKKLNLCINDIEAENGQRDGTVAHAVERLFNLAVNSSGFYCTETTKPSEKLVVGDDSSNRVIVIN